MYQKLLKPLYLDIQKFILDTLFPISCLGCQKEGKEFVCLDCEMTIKKVDTQRCIICQKPAVFGLAHEKCQTPHSANGLISFFDYHDSKISEIIIGGKYKFIRLVFNRLGKIVSERIKQEHSLLTASSYELVYIPLHKTRRRWRGFNQAEILCQEISKQLSFPVIDALIRNKLTKTQKDLKKEQRQKNMANAFKIKPGVYIKNKNIILVDDVTTTGATLNQAAKILKQNGAKTVICLTVARD